MELARQTCESQYVLCAIRSLKKAKDISPHPLPIVSLLLAQAEASIGSTAKWEINLRDEWFSWPPGLLLLTIAFRFCFMYNLDYTPSVH